MVVGLAKTAAEYGRGGGVGDGHDGGGPLKGKVRRVVGREGT